MSTSSRAMGLGALAILMIAAIPACGQTVERRVSAAPAGNVVFHFASKPAVCGDGRYYIRTDDNSWYGSMNDWTRNAPCERGPVRVLIVRDGREPLRMQTFVGPLATEPNATDLGAVSAADAASYLLGIAARVDGRPARDAMLPAMLADSANVTRELLALSKDATRPREVRRNALSWLVRQRGERGGLSSEEVSRTLTTVARDESENRDVRAQAVSSLMRLETAEGLAAVVAMSREVTDPWLASRSVQSLASSGDPRARQHVRDAAERGELSEEARVAAINGLAGEYATSRDAQFLRELYRKVNSDRLRDAALGGVARIGGVESRDWLIAIARSPDEQLTARKKAIGLADQIGMTAADLGLLYDRTEDSEIRATIITELAQNGTRVASEKLIAIAKLDPSVSNRRRAVQALGRFDDPRVREALKELVQRS